MFYNCFQQENPRNKSAITTTPLSSLKEITAKNLDVGSTHYGCFIKLTIESAFQMAAVQIEASDSNKQILTLSIYNFPFKGKSYEHYFHKGVVLYVKEPFYKVTMSGTLGIRVDDPSDVEFEKDAQKNNSIQEKKAEGREFVKKAKYVEAYAIYDELLKKPLNDKDKCTILINKAIVCFQLNLKQEYKENIEKALKIDPKNQKAHFHLIKANTICLDEPNTVERYENLRKKIKQNKNLSEQSKKDLNEFISFHQSFQTNQKIDWHKAIKTQDLGEYWSPKIKVDKSPYGRGIFATETILPGEFLIIEKALAWNKFQRTQNLDSQGKNQQIIMHWKTSDRFAANIIPLFKLSAQLQKKLFTLSSKYYTGDKINSMNRPKDRDQIESIFQTNAFTDYQLTNIFDGQKNYDEHDSYKLIYEKICLINHQCENNCDRFNIGTSGIIYATREIKSGEQLSILYKPIEDVKERQQALKTWGIYDCRCLLCREQRGEHIDEKQGQSYSKYYFSSSFKKIEKNSLSWQTISKKMFGLFLVANLYNESISNPVGDQILAQMFNLDQNQLKDLKNTFK